MKSKIFNYLLLFPILYCSCNKFVEVPPSSTSLSSSTVYDENGTAIAIFNGLYAGMSSGSFTNGMSGVSIQSGLSADELTLLSGSYVVYEMLYQNNLSSQQNIGPWSTIYNDLLTVNAALDGMAISTTLTPSVKQQLEGEAKFLRAFYYFYLVNLYGDVPYTTSTDYKINAQISRTPKDDVYKLIISDLKDAQSLLSANYLGPDIISVVQDRVRPTKWAAAALLARTYLYTGDWKNAEAEADTVISNTTDFSLLPDLNSVFLANSNESIWQLMSVTPGFNTQDAVTFILTSGPNYNNPVYLSSFLLSAFEAGDQRRTDWIDSVVVDTAVYYFPYKYKNGTYGAPVTENLMIFRLAELYLIRAEARAEQNDLPDAASDLNGIRNRAKLSNTTATTQADLLMAIQHERQVELFTEWGHRWLDLKRTGTVGAVMHIVTPQKGGTWNDFSQLYPLFKNDLKLDRNLTQNPGY